MAGKVVLTLDDQRFGKPGTPAAELTLAIAGAAHTLAATEWKGAPTNPYTFEEMAQRFLRYAAPHLSDARQEEVVHRVAALEREEDVAELARLLEGG